MVDEGDDAAGVVGEDDVGEAGGEGLAVDVFDQDGGGGGACADAEGGSISCAPYFEFLRR